MVQAALLSICHAIYRTRDAVEIYHAVDECLFFVQTDRTRCFHRTPMALYRKYRALEA